MTMTKIPENLHFKNISPEKVRCIKSFLNYVDATGSNPWYIELGRWNFEYFSEGEYTRFYY